jgi:uncharacterized protein (DUF1330 family)
VAAYIVLNIEVIDPVHYADYAKAAGATVEQYGGRYLARGGKADRLEGAVSPKRIVILEFPSYEQATAWWTSAEYAAPKGIRQSAAVSETLIVDGV